MDDALTIASRFVTNPLEVRDLELAILRHMEHHMMKERERCAKIAEAHKGSTAKRRAARGIKFNQDALVEIYAEERGEDIAAEMIAKAIRA